MRLELSFKGLREGYVSRICPESVTTITIYDKIIMHRLHVTISFDL